LQEKRSPVREVPPSLSRKPEAFVTEQWFERDPLWFKHSVF
jgi:hypothetical protein